MVSCHVDFELSMIARNGRSNHDFVIESDSVKNLFKR